MHRPRNGETIRIQRFTCRFRPIAVGYSIAASVTGKTLDRAFHQDNSPVSAGLKPFCHPTPAPWPHEQMGSGRQRITQPAAPEPLRCPTHCVRYRSRSAVMMFKRTARTAGSSPPSNPITSANNTPCASTRGPNRKENVISLKLLTVPVDNPLKGSVARHPSRPPNKHKTTYRKWKRHVAYLRFRTF